MPSDIKDLLSPQARAWLARRRREVSHMLRPIAKRPDFDGLRRVTPVRRQFGWTGGLPVDRYYIERFLDANAADVKGHVLEIQSDVYTRQFGGDRVLRTDVLDLERTNPPITIVADLTDAPQIPSDTFDCIIFTQTLQFIYDVRAATRTLHRILKPGGVVLATAAGITQICRSEMDRGGDFWRLTTCSAARLFGETFPAGQVTVRGDGNVLAAIAFLHGFTVEELDRAELDYVDPDYEVLISIRAEKPADPPGRA